jgi:potassium efflux system protein
MGPAWGVETAAPQSLPAISAQQVEAEIKEIEAGSDLDEATRNKLIELYRKVQSHLEKARSSNASMEGFSRARESAPKEAQEIRAQLERLEGTDPLQRLTPSVGEDTALAELEQMLVKEQADLAAVQAKLAELDKKIQDDSARPDLARQRLTEAKRLQEDTASELKSLPTEAADPTAEARRMLLETQQRATSAEIHMLDQELLSQPMRLKLLKAQRDLSARNLSNIQARVHYLEDIVNRRRQAEAEQVQARAAEAEREAATKPPIIRTLARKNADLGRELAQMAARLASLSAHKEAMGKRAKDYEKELQSARQKLEIAGLSRALGKILQDQRRRLPNLAQYEKQATAREELIVEASLRQIDHTEERNTLSDLDAALETLLGGVPVAEQEKLHDELREALKTRRELLDKAIATDNAYLRALGELDFAQKRLIHSAQAYERFLSENLLWVPNAPPVSLATVAKLPGEFAWLLAPRAWIGVLDALGEGAVRAPLLPILMTLLVGGLLWYRRRLRSALKASGERVGRLSSDSIGLTLQALLYTLLIAAPWPALMWSVGWLLRHAPGETGFAAAVGEGLSITGPMLFNLLGFRVFCAPAGVADAHFRWSQQVLRLLRRNLDWFTLLAIPLAFVVVVSADHAVSLSRLGYLVVMVSLAAFLHRILGPNSGAVRPYLRRHPRGWLARSRYLWYPVAVGAPLALAVLALVGYYYTAGTLTSSLVDTLWLALGLTVARDLTLRWLALARRRLALQVARQRREAERAAQQEGAQTLAEAASIELDVPEVNLEAIDAQTRQLMNAGLAMSAAVGLWLIWADVLPALGILDKITLWQHMATANGETRLLPVTLADIALAIVITTLTLVATRNLPGVLEIALLRHLSLDTGSRYAIGALLRYTLIAIGVAVVFNVVGGSWSQIQWLVAALSVGVGFGLQEIVANFISGLIILFERPIRVGDIITIGDTTGIVSRIRIRATTITSWDKQELLVPNKEFITGRLLNWTLSDQMNRIVITVGAAYGCDVKKAMELMAEAADEHERILGDPTPIVTFEGFGDNSLTLLLRCYLDSLEFRLATISELHEAINRKFEQAGIVIAFPQRDVHLDTSQPLDIRIHGMPKPAPDQGRD